MVKHIYSVALEPKDYEQLLNYAFLYGLTGRKNKKANLSQLLELIARKGFKLEIV